MELILTSIVVFAGTNIDDIFILMLFFGNQSYSTKAVILGQYIGIGTLVFLSYICSLLNHFVDERYIGLLGFLPLYLGIKGLVQLRGKVEQSRAIKKDSPYRQTASIASVAIITIANGGDNIGIYIPIFVTLSITQKAVMIFVFLFMTALWCLFAKYLTKHPLLAKVIDKYGHIVTPFVLIGLGIYILYNSSAYLFFFR
ncbi:MAG: quaternary ammonium transporter [Chitinophagaceae bacterium]|nr:MAG: quaternary ammonium transporter [Chitinophagaceae bacterium]